MYNFFIRSCGNLVNFVFSSRSKNSGDISTVSMRQTLSSKIVGKLSRFSRLLAYDIPLVLHAKNHQFTPEITGFYPVSTAPIITTKRKVN